MFAQITKGLSESIDKALAKHAPAQNLGQNLSHQNITKSAQNLASQARHTPQTQARQALTRFGNELAQNSQTKPTQAVFDFDFIARDKTPEIPKQSTQNPPSSAQADTGGGLFDLPSQAKQKDELLQNLQHAPAQSHTTQAQNLAPHTPQSQSLQARYDTLHDFASKKAKHKESLSHEAKSLYDSFAKSLDSLSPESLSAKELNATDRHLSEYLVHTELAQVSNAKDIVLPYFSAKYQAKNEAELAQTFGSDKLAQMRQALQESKNTNPLAEFGTNYAEFYQDGKGAIAKLIAEANAAKEAGQDFSGQVAGAFYRDDLGEITLAWGDSNKGLAHIIERRTQDNIDRLKLDEKEAQQKALDFVKNELSKIIENGKLEFSNTLKPQKAFLHFEDKKAVIALNYNNKDKKWILTAYQKNDTPRPAFPHKSEAHGDDFSTSSSAVSKDIISQTTLFKTPKSTQETYKPFKPSERTSDYDFNLKDFTKDNHAITKITKNVKIQKGYKWIEKQQEQDRKFYHYTNSPKLGEFSAEKDKSGLGFWFVGETDNNFISKQKQQEAKVFFGNHKKEVYLSIKKPFLDGKAIQNTALKEAKNELKEVFRDNAQALKIINDEKMQNKSVEQFLEALEMSRMQSGAKELKDLLQKQGYDAINFNDNSSFGGGVVVFSPNQIKAVGNKGTFDGTNPNIYHSSSTAGGGVLGGSIAGVERDEEGNIIGFSPEKFALGFASGAAGAKALSKIANTKPVQNLANTITQNRASQNLANTKTITLSQKSIQKLATNPRAKAVLDKIKSKNDIIATQKITKGQEMQKTSINFTTDKDQPISQIRNKAKSILNLLLNQKITNKNDGRIAIVSAQGRDKILSSEACKKSVSNGFSKEEHFSASEHIKELYENSKYIKSEPARNNSVDIKHYHRYIADLEVNKKPAQALLTLKELIKDGNRIYSLELQEIRPLPQSQAHTKQAGQGQS